VTPPIDPFTWKELQQSIQAFLHEDVRDILNTQLKNNLALREFITKAKQTKSFLDIPPVRIKHDPDLPEQFVILPATPFSALMVMITTFGPLRFIIHKSNNNLIFIDFLLFIHTLRISINFITL